MRAPVKPVAAVDAGAPPKEAREKKKKRRRGGDARRPERGAAGQGHAASPPMEAEPEPIKLSAADLKLVSQGDDLSRPDVVRLGDATDDSGSRELTQDDIDARFRAEGRGDPRAASCAPAPTRTPTFPGRVTVKFRIQRTGNVRGVRVEAPAILQKGGIYGCIKGVVGGIRFPPSNGSQVVSYPFSLT